jgi:hypothetical protein
MGVLEVRGETKMSDAKPSEMGEKFSQEFMERLNACETPEEVATLFRDHAVETGYATRDIDPSVLHPTGKAPTTPKISRTVTVGNQSYTIEAANEEGLKEIELELYRRAFQQQQSQQPQAQQRDSQGRFTAQEQQQEQQLNDAAANAVMDLADARMKHLSGEISDAEFADFVLKTQGVDPNALREIITEREENSFEQGWIDATEEFLNSEQGSTWVGGERNKDIITVVSNPRKR